MLSILRRTISIALIFYIPFSAAAWGTNGHRIVGEIASHYLTINAKKAVAKILGTESIAMASNYADFIKSDSLFAYVSPWHYVNMPETLTKPQIFDFLDKDTSVDAYTQLDFLIKQLKNHSLDADKKVFYLKLLLHIVGDIHQPMHTGRAADQGGNKIKVFWFNESSNLHRVWDDQIITSQQLSYTEYVAAINHTTPGQLQKWQKFTLKDWLYDSYLEAEKIYAFTKPDAHFSYQYNYVFLKTINAQLLKGGVHLATLLNKIYG